VKACPPIQINKSNNREHGAFSKNQKRKKYNTQKNTTK
jgi:hypothetical protein